MKKFLLFITAVFLIIITILLHGVSKHFYLYWQTDWVDSLAHFFGGMATGLFFLGFEYFRRPSVLIYVLIIGALWEIFEYQFGLIHYSGSYIADTLSDLAMDLLGGILAYVVVKYIVIPWRN